MSLVYVAYAYVKAGGPVPACSLRSVSTEIATYLTSHIDALHGRAVKESSPPAEFLAPEAKQRFQDLLSGSEDAFLAAAQELTANLHMAMPGNAARGFFVVLRESVAGSPRAAALKLDVQKRPMAAARQVGMDTLLESVKDLLDSPGELQKGAVYPDPRGDSQVVVGDKSIEDPAKYFLRAIQVEQIAHPRLGSSLVLRTVSAIAPAKAGAVAHAIARYTKEVTASKIFEDHPNLLAEAERTRVITSLESQTRPVRLVNPVLRPPRAVIKADGITISGLAAAVDPAVHWYRRDGKWVIEVSVSEEPRRLYE
jgi:hypothetical protein